MKKVSPLILYEKEISEGHLKKDIGQFDSIKLLDVLFFQITENINSKNVYSKIFFNLFSSRKSKSKKLMKGIYLYGGVGRGKTLLMDIFANAIPKNICQRFHFHDFMIKAQKEIKIARERNNKNPISLSVNNLIKPGHIICFDEMEVRDIADAMIIKRLFDTLWDKGMILVTTSNRAPEELYLNGLHRDRFLPFIKKITKKLIVHKISDGLDWRKNVLSGVSGWYQKSSKNHHEKTLNKIFSKLSKSAKIRSEKIIVASREIKFNKVAADIADIEFKNLCMASLSARDYLVIADRFSGIILRNIPKMGDQEQNEARRFIWLIDALYDRNRFLIASADSKPTKLYCGSQWSFEFERTCSRLEEMSRMRGIKI